MSKSALTAAQSRVLGFEAPTSDWTRTSGTLAKSSRAAAGSASLSISGVGYTEIRSVALSSLGSVDATVGFKLLLPTSQPNPSYYGQVSLYIEVPSKGINAFVGQTDLTGMPLNVFNDLIYPLPLDLARALSGTYTDLRFKIALNVPYNTSAYLIDALELGPALPLQTLSALQITLPHGLVPRQVAVATRYGVRVTDRAKVLIQEDGSLSAPVANTGTSFAHVGVTGQVGTLFSQGPVDLRSNAIVQGDVESASTIHTQPGVSISGSARPGASLGPMRATTWTPVLPTRPGGDVLLDVNQRRTISPGRYATVSVKTGARLTLGAGTYRLGRLTLEPDSKLVLSSIAAPTVLYVDADFTYRGKIVYAADESTVELPVLVVVMGTTQVPIERPFNGTVFAPNAHVAVIGGVHHATFFGAEVELQPDAVVLQTTFPWSTVVPETPIEWGDSPVSLNPWIQLDTGESHPDSVTLGAPIQIEIPRELPVTTGNAGNGVVEVELNGGSGAAVVCTYRGGATVAHPDTDLERMRGRRYLFDSCTDGSQAGDTVQVNQVGVEIISGDSDSYSGVVSVALSAGYGCNGTLPPPLAPEEVVATRENFNWATMNNLAETDEQGRPALYHVMIYIERKEQVAALDRLRVYWSSRPLSARYNSQFNGKCGRVEHATDGRGVVVYAVMPGKLFNVLRTFSIDAASVGKEPPFRFVLPTIPDQPEYVNPSGSLRYEALASSRFDQWLEAHPGALPSWYGDAWDAISDAAEDGWNWAKDNIVEPAYDYRETVYDYAASTFSDGIEWAANGLDDFWEEVQSWLHDLVSLTEDTIDLPIQVRIVNRDSAFVPDSLFERGWGEGEPDPGSPGGLARHKVVPAKAKLRVRQWGWGFLPIMNEDDINEDGRADLTAIEGASGRGGDLCLELDAPYGSITTDLIPNEVCDFAEYRYWNFAGKFYEGTDELRISQPDVFSFTQMKDSFDYSKAVIGYEPHKMEVLTGWVANDITGILKTLTGAEHRRAQTLCLDFPYLGTSALTTIMSGLTGGGSLPPPYAGMLDAVASVILDKDLWWPDADESNDARNSRGVMTHEYGHFNTCSLLYSAGGAFGGPSALRGLMMRLVQGETGDSDVSYMLETIADTYAMQVTGGVNYLELRDNWTAGPMTFCTTNPCLDKNYAGDDYVGDDFEKKIAVYESLVQDAFDRADSANRNTNAPWNGDVWQLDPASGLLSFAPVGYIANDDEPVSLPGSAWKDWAANWLARGNVPYTSNVIGGLVDTMIDHGATWCDACEVLAAHSTATPDAARMPDAAGTRTMQVRFDRWRACSTNSTMHALLPGLPEPGLNVDATCTACAPLHYVDTSSGPTAGQCVPCPAGQIPKGDHCEPCPAGSVPTPSNTCSGCGPNEISVGDVCEPCPTGQGADKTLNVCADCPMDATIDWETLLPSCREMAEPDMTYNASPTDICPTEFWVEVRNLHVLNDRGWFGLRIEADPLHSFTDPGAWMCTQNQSTIDVFQALGTGLGSTFATSSINGVYAGCGPVLCGDACLSTAEVIVPVSAIDAGLDIIRVRASTSLYGNPVCGWFEMENIVPDDCGLG